MSDLCIRTAAYTLMTVPCLATPVHDVVFVGRAFGTSIRDANEILPTELSNTIVSQEHKVSEASALEKNPLLLDHTNDSAIIPDTASTIISSEEEKSPTVSTTTPTAELADSESIAREARIENYISISSNNYIFMIEIRKYDIIQIKILCSKENHSVLSSFIILSSPFNHLLQQVMATQHDDKDNENVKETMRNSPTSRNMRGAGRGRGRSSFRGKRFTPYSKRPKAHQA
ncbi:unnamed protein product, partial [Trichogramma brassicae]